MAAVVLDSPRLPPERKAPFDERGYVIFPDGLASLRCTARSELPPLRRTRRQPPSRRNRAGLAPGRRSRCSPPPPRPSQGVSTIWAVDRFTAENGATEVIPGSHLWDHGPLAADGMHAQSVTLELEPGSVALFHGSLYHRGGANRSTGKRFGLTIQYCQPWLRQLENLMLGTPPELAARYSKWIQELVGYNLVHETFVGYVDGRHPRKLIEDRND